MIELLTQMANLIGIIGVIVLVLAYYLLQSNRLSSKSISYSLMNVIGASFILYSLILDWNTPAVIMESVWIVISLAALFKAITKKNA
ncbi:CBU_0592 family membrane protein [Candidatus Berkiella aquae]|uniref:CBU-0592-like domain-containing protein n=1 Tax=Candidatus Berkiella aquae TaxID=295108 RepID=A0A0Q9YWR0_9GAMM|nr:hypothetical protein [Candidatus Berkiella aquae]MCS5710171.1 hypothetical protein [Candidatus Berkiella aquae]